ncbi:monovalent cation/H+ antiporter complex subunit F [Legionella impletisoli]|uniref:Sodium:proton antiporter n=1 Tax=Legionella impletisoli TaxID=343510 RepID=A0A917JZG2_9GAMM|nr:monovalent cation/H+ antiporter complex subunit F [Legionella impletisoli]GGI90359.1 sodium:proton antiporter [Legionella impletisoli]
MSILFWLACLLIILAAIFCFTRLVLGPGIPDRVVALDLVANVIMASIALYSVYTHQAIYLDIVVALALVMFLSSTMYAYYLERKRNVGKEDDKFFE